MPPPTTELRTFQIDGVGLQGEILDTWFVEAPDSRQALSRLSENLAEQAETVGWCIYTLQYCADIRITEVAPELATPETGTCIPHVEAA